MRSFARRAAFLTVLTLLAPSAGATEGAGSGQLAFDRDDNIYSSDSNGEGEVALVQDGESHTPRWSPDGKLLLFIRNTSLQTVVYDDGSMEAIGQPTDLYTVNRDGHDLHLIRHLDGVVSDPSWAPDGKTIGFFYQSKEEWMHQGTPPFQSGFYEMPADGNEKPHLISSEARNVDWSPDSKRIVFTVARPANHVALHTASSNGSGETQLLDEETFVNADYARWSPDGEQIAYQSTVRRRMPGNKFVFQSTIFTVHPDGSHIRQLTYDHGWDCWHPFWTPGSTRLNYSCYSMPQCMPAMLKQSPDGCISRRFIVQTDDPHAKPVQVVEQVGAIIGETIPQISPK